jgi:hypothetical protein
MVDGHLAQSADPWNADPQGIPDTYSGQSCALRTRTLHSLTTNNIGHAAGWFHPIIDGTATISYHAAALVSPATDTIASWAPADHPDVAALTAGYSRYRPVSCGIKVMPINAESTLAGVVGIATMDGLAGTGDIPTSVLEISDSPVSRTIQCSAMTEPLCCVLNPFDAPRFSASMVGAFHTESFPGAVVFITNGPISSACLRIEVTTIYELIPLYTNVISVNHATRTDFNHTSLMQVSRRLSTTRVGTEKAVTTIKPISANYIRKNKTYKRRYPARKTYGTKYSKKTTWKRRFV